MSIDFDKFLAWAESRFDDVRVKGNEILLNSIFCEDHKHHLWCNPTGGKTNSPTGVFHCWKSDEKGSLVRLVMLVDKCPYEEALDTLDAVNSGSLADLEKKVQEIFKQKITPAIEMSKEGLELPPDCFSFEDLPSFNPTLKAAVEYLDSRKISAEGLLVCTKGRYRNRILIPYYDKKGSLVYYNGRHIGDSEKSLRYLGPPKELGIGKSDVVYCPRWPSVKSKLYLTEGEFDAITLHQCGFPAAALGGKELSQKQMKIISDYSLALCFDADNAGGSALLKTANILISNGFSGFSYVRPCKEFKDWNGILISKGPKILRHYILSHEKQYSDEWESTKISMNNI